MLSVFFNLAIQFAMSSETRKAIDRAYRAHWGELNAILTRQFGTAHMDMVESVVQESFIKAMERWPAEGVPANPVAWLLTVARNLRLNQVRHGKTAERLEDGITRHIAQGEPEIRDDAVFAHEIRDEQLRMIFVCNHPEVPEDSRIPLTLRTLCGFETLELARAYLVSEDAIKKRLVRGRGQIRDAGLVMDLPGGEATAARLDSVLATLYLLFSEGYAPHDGDRHIRHDLATEAIRLGDILLSNPRTAVPRAHALQALMYFQASRFNSRTDEHGAVLVLRDQDRSLWDQAIMRRGFIHLAESAKGEDLSRYHLEASIAACHARAPGFEATDWKLIVSLYDMMLRNFPSDIVAVAHAVAVGQEKGPDAGLKLLGKLVKEGRLAHYAPLHAAQGDCYERLGQAEKATQALTRALSFAQTEPERAHLRAKIAALNS